MRIGLLVMPSLYELHAHRPLASPVLLLATESWVDAGLGAQAAIAQILQTIPTEVLATFSPDDLIDFRSRRPIVRISDGVVDHVSWPEIQLLAGQDAVGRDVLVLVGPEPDMAWHAFVRAVVGLAVELGVRLVAGLGAYAAPVPHTRPVGLMAIATTAELAAQVGVVAGTAEMPAGIQTALQEGFAAAGVPAIGVWARVPHYLAAIPYPAASAALVDALAAVAGLELDAGPLHAAAGGTLSHINEVIANSEEYLALVRRLEAAFDGELTALPDFSDLPTGDELAAELERFLRGEQGEQ
ncbi:MAG: PAC2 family protein [Pseudonocardiaceae bacterium]